MAFTEIDEKLLVRAYQAGDDRAFDTIVRTQYNALYAHAMRRLSNHESAEDAVQDTLLRAYRALPNLDGDLALRAWLHRILTNVCHDEGNRRRRQQGLIEKIEALPEESVEDIADEATLFDTVRVMQEALEDLPESYREALVLRYVDGLSFREVAEATGVSEENARARVHRGRLALHKVMSRLAVMAAFIIPGLKRTQQAATSPGAEQAAATSSSGAAEHVVSLGTQLTSHVVNAAPAVSRFAEMSAALPGGKSTLAAAAVTAVAAVTVPVAYTVNEVRKPERPAAVAAPAQESGFGQAGTEVTTPSTAAGGTPTTASPGTSSPTSSTSTTLPASLERPFELAPGVTATTTPRKPDATTTTSTTAAPVVEQGTLLTGRLEGTIAVTAAAPQYDLRGEVDIHADDAVHSAEIEGRLHLHDDGTATADELVLVIGDRRLVLRFTGTHRREADGSSRLTGRYSLVGGTDFGLAESGEATGSFAATGERATLVLDLRGRSSS
jgi:RNA polymerase sigma-70 factor, ECF subfamily